MRVTIRASVRGSANPLASTMIASRRRLGSVIATSASSSEESSLRQQMHPPEIENGSST